MKQTTVKYLKEYVGETVQLQGWLYNKRSSGKIHFLQFRDGTGTVQAVAAKADVDEALFEQLRSLTQESSIRITGEVREDDRSPGGVELTLGTCELVQQAVDYPIAKQAHGPDFLLNHRHLWLRSQKQWATIRVRHEVVRAIRDFFDERDFVLLDAPIFTPAACEGTSTLFEVNYFDDKAYLTQSGQLYQEAGAMAHGKVYCFGPTFRAERSKTRKHLTEFWMVEPEMAYYDLDMVIDLAEAFVCFIVERVLANRRQELGILERDPAALEKITGPFARITYDEAIELLQKAGSEIQWGGDFGAPDETMLGDHFGKPVFVHHWPTEVKAFYMKQDPDNPKVVKAVDLIAPDGYGEIIGGSQREDDLDVLEGKIEEHNLPKEAFEWYLDLRRYGSVPHGGFGLGLERMVAWMCGTEHIRETIPFPRMLYRIYP